MNFEFTRLAMIISLMILFTITGCDRQSAVEEQTAKKYCSSCHLFPEPNLLQKTVWEKQVLPAMASKMGIRYFRDSPYEANQLPGSFISSSSSDNEIISVEDWKKIISFYKDKAPSSEPRQDRGIINNFTDRFNVTEVRSEENKSTTSFLKIDEGNHWVYAANAEDSSLNIYNDQLHLISKIDLHGVMVDMLCTDDMRHSGPRSGVLTNIGIMNPNDLSTGTADSFVISNTGTVTFIKEVLNKMPRPVQTIITDLDHDAKPDYLVCGFGNTNGALYWMKNLGNNQYQQNFIRALPGAIKAYVNDFNHDGLPDIIVLMAQAQEGIFLFTNRGNGTFDAKPLLKFPPVYGSSYFELDDFNNDGFPDILYTCGDNADFTFNSLKNYHGVYIFLNDGKYNFTQKYFFPIHGCYKAMAKDFDKDGDLDIAAISFFPDKKNQPQESFVFLENKGSSSFKDNFKFEPYGIKQFNTGRWLTMDAADLNGDGYDDIVLGNFNPPEKNPTQAPSNLSFLLLENKAKSR